VLEFLDQWRLARKAEPFEYIFDWMERKDARRKEIELVMEQMQYAAKQLNMSERDYANYSFRCRENFPGLQCVDALGWTCYQYALSSFHNVPMHPLGSIAWNDFVGHLGGHGDARDWFVAATVERSKLETFVQMEIADGRSIVRFKDFYSKRADAKTPQNLNARKTR
jgi:hypothetical protein